MWQVVLAFLFGLGVAEYYNRGRIDKIRREQLQELRAERRARYERQGGANDGREAAPYTRRV